MDSTMSSTATKLLLLLLLAPSHAKQEGAKRHTTYETAPARSSRGYLRSKKLGHRNYKLTDHVSKYPNDNIFSLSVPPANVHRVTKKASKEKSDDRVPCVSRSLSVAYSFRVAAPDATEALVAGDYVSSIVLRVLQAELVAQDVDCSKGSVMGLSNVRAAVENGDCSLGESESSSSSCFVLSAGVLLDFTGPSDETSKAIEDATESIEEAFGTMSGPNRIDLLGVTEIPLGGRKNGNNRVTPVEEPDQQQESQVQEEVREEEPEPIVEDEESEGDRVAEKDIEEEPKETVKEDDEESEGDRVDEADADKEDTDSDIREEPKDPNGDGDKGKQENSDMEERRPNPEVEEKTDEEEPEKEGPEARSENPEDGDDEVDDDLITSTSPERSEQTASSRGTRVYVPSFLLALFASVAILVGLYLKKKQGQNKSSSSDSQDTDDRLKNVQIPSPRDTESVSDEHSLDSAFFHPQNKSIGFDDDASDYSSACTSQNVMSSGRSIQERPVPGRQQVLTGRESLKKYQEQDTRRKMQKRSDPVPFAYGRVESPPSSPLSQNASLSSFSLQGSPIAANESDIADHSILYDVIMTPAGRITRVHVETFDSASDREKNAKFYNHSDLKQSSRTQPSPTDVSRIDDSSYAMTDSMDLSQRSNSPLRVSRATSLFDGVSVDDTVDL